MDTHPKGGGSSDSHKNATRCGMPGTGTNYARRIGIVGEHIRGGPGSEPRLERVGDLLFQWKSTCWQGLKQEVDCLVEIRLKFLLASRSPGEKPFDIREFDPNLSDIRSAIQAESARYDAMFSRGSTCDKIQRDKGDAVQVPDDP